MLLNFGKGEGLVGDVLSCSTREVLGEMGSLGQNELRKRYYAIALVQKLFRRGTNKAINF